MIWKTFLEVRREPLTSVSLDVAVKMPDEGRILINLCGKNNVRNCDLLQSDSFARVGPS